MIYGYIRVSTEEQNLENQKKAISEKYEIDEMKCFILYKQLLDTSK